MLIYSDCVLDAYLRAPNYDYFCGRGLDQHWVGLDMGGGSENIFKHTFGLEGCVLPEDARVSLQPIRLMHDYNDGNAKDTVDGKTVAGKVTAASLHLRCLTGGAENTPLAPTPLHFSEKGADAADLSPLVSKFPRHDYLRSVAGSMRIHHISAVLMRYRRG